MWGIITLVRVLIRYQNFCTWSPHGHLRRLGPRLRIYERVMQPTSLTTLRIVAYSQSGSSIYSPTTSKKAGLETIAFDIR